MTAAVECRGLRKTYDGRVEAVRGLDFEIPAGECFGLLGPNGAGKTTTIEILEGLLAPTAGEVRLFGLGWRRHAGELREQVGISLQETRLAEKLTVRETLRLFASFYRDPRPVDEVLAELELTEKAGSWVGKLSGGQRQRLAVATALVGRPRLLFLDEPTTGLDPQSRRQLWELVTRFRAQGGTLVLTTHYMEEAERLCDRVAIVDQGRIVALGAPRQLIGSLAGGHVLEFELEAGAAPLPAGALRALPGVAAVRMTGLGAEVTVGELHVALPALAELAHRHGAGLAHLATHPATLEDVFMNLTGRRLRDE